jgi:hypothetical protein
VAAAGVNAKTVMRRAAIVGSGKIAIVFLMLVAMDTTVRSILI